VNGKIDASSVDGVAEGSIVRPVLPVKDVNFRSEVWLATVRLAKQVSKKS
jgi:hypothetical protein